MIDQKTLRQKIKEGKSMEMTSVEVAEALGIDLATVNRNWSPILDKREAAELVESALARIPQ